MFEEIERKRKANEFKRERSDPLETSNLYLLKKAGT